jgi:hypothetical protein
MNAFEEGWIAAESGKSLRDNPYAFGPDRALWRNGYLALYISLGLPVS